MYSDHLLTLSKDTRFVAPPSEGARVAERRNPACGDEIRVGLDITGNRIVRLRYQVQACAVTRAAAAALGRAVEGHLLAESRARAEEVLAFLEGHEEWSTSWGEDDIPALGSLRAFPMRLACVRLPFEAFLAALPIE